VIFRAGTDGSDAQLPFRVLAWMNSSRRIEAREAGLRSLTGAEDRRSQRLARSRVSLPKAVLRRRANHIAAVCITGATPPKVKLTEREVADPTPKPCNRSISPASNSSEHFNNPSPTNNATSPYPLNNPPSTTLTTRQNVQGIHLQRCVRAHLESKSHPNNHNQTPRNRQWALTPLKRKISTWSSTTRSTTAPVCCRLLLLQQRFTQRKGHLSTNLTATPTNQHLPYQTKLTTSLAPHRLRRRAPRR
jgi:hypothetical protein